MKNLSLIIALLLMLSSCGNSKTNKEKLKEELKAELKEEMKKEMQEEADKESDSEEQTNPTEAASEANTPDNAAQTERTSPKKVSFGVDMLKNLTLYGNKSVVRFKQNNAVTYSLVDGSKKGIISYDGDDLEDATRVIPEKQALIIKIHQDFAIGGIIGIEKTSCERGRQTEFQYSFKISWENESNLNDAGCAFHTEEEYQIVANVGRMSAGTGGVYYIFRDSNGENYDFYADNNRGINLSDHFPELSPLSNDNPYENKKYRLFYKFVEVEDHRGFRVAPIVTYIEEIYSVD